MYSRISMKTHKQVYTVLKTLILGIRKYNAGIKIHKVEKGKYRDRKCETEDKGDGKRENRYIELF